MGVRGVRHRPLVPAQSPEEATRRGLNTTPSKEKPSKPLVISHFSRLLRHPYYKGVVRYRGVEYPGSHPPLISEETWDRVQAMLDAHGKAVERQREHHHYLKGSIYCGECGSRLIITKSTNRHGKTYEYFICIGRHQRRKACLQPATLIERVEYLIAEHYRLIQLPAWFIEDVQAGLS